MINNGNNKNNKNKKSFRNIGAWGRTGRVMLGMGALSLVSLRHKSKLGWFGLNELMTGLTGHKRGCSFLGRTARKK